MQSSRFRVQGSGLRVQGAGFGVEGSGPARRGGVESLVEVSEKLGAEKLWRVASRERLQRRNVPADVQGLELRVQGACPPPRFRMDAACIMRTLRKFGYAH